MAIENKFLSYSHWDPDYIYLNAEHLRPQVNKLFPSYNMAQSTLQEHQWILTNATVSKDSDSGFILVVYENFFLLLWSVWKKLGNVEIFERSLDHPSVK